MRPLDGYPQPFGYSKGSVFPHAGPDDYTVVVEGSPGTVPIVGGDLVEAVEAGLKLLDYVGFAITDDGLYTVQPIPPSNQDSMPIPSSTWALRWVVNSTGAEVAAHTDLSGQIVRLFALGPK